MADRSARHTVADLGDWLASLDWLTSAAWLLTLGCLGCAVLDSYTSLCVVGADQGHIGRASACPDFGGWDTRVFPLAVDMGWGGALFAVLRLASVIGLQSWRWWVVLGFEVITAAFTVAGNAFHGAVVDGATAHIPDALQVVISSVVSAVPGVVAVGSGFTLSVLVSTRPAAELPVTRAAREEPVQEPAGRSEVAAPAIIDAGRRGRRPASEVLALVRAARGRLTAELVREPSDAEVASRVSADGHPITASRVRSYLAQIRAEERAQPAADESGTEEVVAWRTR
ncbi:MAG TPA: hypothetical protein VLW53_07665 [Candidatus Eisenbacteria bacterium]|nr:hypothetical protein [Candidatus Eisenbacteria bacterium]